MANRYVALMGLQIPLVLALLGCAQATTTSQATSSPAPTPSPRTSLSADQRVRLVTAMADVERLLRASTVVIGVDDPTTPMPRGASSSTSPS